MTPKESNMKCDYCKDPIYKFQKRKIRKKKPYHAGCYDLMLDNIINRVKKSNKVEGDRNDEYLDT